MEILNPSTSAKTVMTKLQNLFVALVNMDTFQMTLKLSLFTVFVLQHCEHIFVYADMQNVCRCMQMYAGLHVHISWLAPFELV